jgi:short-subunit dehydrogenase
MPLNIKKHFTGKHVLITGASSGIGKSLAYSLHEFVDTLHICGRDEKVLLQIKKDLPKSQIHAFEISNQKELKQSLDKIESLDILISNAGTCEYIDFPDLNSDSFERVIQTNFLGNVYLIKELLPLLLKSSSPQLVTVNSSVSFLPLPRAEAYGASKAALDYMIEAMRISLQKEKIKFTTIYPGFIKTPLTDKNDFPMPFIMESTEAARRIINAIIKKQSHCHFPKKLTLIFKIIGLLPNPLKQILLKQKFAK